MEFEQSQVPRSQGEPQESRNIDGERVDDRVDLSRDEPLAPFADEVSSGGGIKTHMTNANEAIVNRVLSHSSGTCLQEASVSMEAPGGRNSLSQVHALREGDPGSACPVDVGLPPAGYDNPAPRVRGPHTPEAPSSSGANLNAAPKNPDIRPQAQTLMAKPDKPDG